MEMDSTLFEAVGFRGATNNVVYKLPEWVHNINTKDPVQYDQLFTANFNQYLQQVGNRTSVENLTLDDLKQCCNDKVPLFVEHDDKILYGTVIQQKPIIHDDRTGSIEIKANVGKKGLQKIRDGLKEISVSFETLYSKGIRGKTTIKEYSLVKKGRINDCKIKKIGETAIISNNSDAYDKINYEECLSNFNNKIYVRKVKLSIKFEEKNKMSSEPSQEPKIEPPKPDTPKTENSPTTTDNNEQNKTNNDEMYKVLLQKYENMNEQERINFLITANASFENTKTTRIESLKSLGFDSGILPENVLSDPNDKCANVLYENLKKKQDEHNKELELVKQENATLKREREEFIGKLSENEKNKKQKTSGYVNPFKDNFSTPIFIKNSAEEDRKLNKPFNFALMTYYGSKAKR